MTNRQALADLHKTCNIREAATLIGVDRETIRAWIKSGQLPAVRDGREWQIPMPFAFYLAVALGGVRLTL
jgi:excisionase family DNA binding protein